MTDFKLEYTEPDKVYETVDTIKDNPPYRYYEIEVSRKQVAYVNVREPATDAPTVNPIATQINLQDLAIAAKFNQLFEAAGLAYARTCIACGLGPCKHPKK